MGNQGNPGDQNQRDDQRKPTGTSGRQSGNDTRYYADLVAEAGNH